jgi:hypothetical protein
MLLACLDIYTLTSGTKRRSVLSTSTALMLLLAGPACFVPVAEAAQFQTVHSEDNMSKIDGADILASASPGELKLASQNDVNSTELVVGGLDSGPAVRRRLVQVSTIGGLRTELTAQTAVIELTAGTYLLGGNELSINHDVEIRAATGATIVLDAGGSSRVLNIQGGTVNLVGLDITGGYRQELPGGGGVFIAGGTISFESCNIYSNAATNFAFGGGVSINDGDVSFTLTNIYKNTADIGVGVHISDGTVTFVSSNIYENNATNAAGGVFIEGGTTSFIGCNIYSNTAVYSFGGGVNIGVGTVSFELCNIYLNRAYNGGGVRVGVGSTATFTGCNIHGNRAAYCSYDEEGNYTCLGSGGGLYVDDAVMTMTTTLVHGNIAAAGGANVMPVGGELYYKLPTTAGYWLPNADCVVNRAPCESWNQDCLDASCNTRAGSHPNWTPTNCKAPTFIQPCNWQVDECDEGSSLYDADKCLLGKKVYFTPYFPIEGTFPNPCVAGYLGSNESHLQTSSDCAGKCPAGTYCPDSPTLQPVLCPSGHYCEAGASVPRPCRSRTYRSVVGGTSQEKAHKLPSFSLEWMDHCMHVKVSVVHDFQGKGYLFEAFDISEADKPIPDKRMEQHTIPKYKF